MEVRAGESGESTNLEIRERDGDRYRAKEKVRTGWKEIGRAANKRTEMEKEGSAESRRRSKGEERERAHRSTLSGRRGGSADPT